MVKSGENHRRDGLEDNKDEETDYNASVIGKTLLEHMEEQTSSRVKISSSYIRSSLLFSLVFLFYASRIL